MFFKNLCILVIWTKVASALKGLITTYFTATDFIKHFPDNRIRNLILHNIKHFNSRNEIEISINIQYTFINSMNFLVLCTTH